MNNEDQNQQSVFKSLLGEATVIACLTFVGYVISIAYEIGYNLYYNIPIYLIPVDITTICISIFGTIGVVAVFSNFFNIIPKEIFNNKTPELQDAIKKFAYLVIAIGVFWYLVSPPDLLQIIFPLVIIIVIGVLLFILPLLHKGQTYEEKLLKYRTNNRLFEAHNPISYFLDFIGNTGLLYILLFILVTFFAATSGYANAKHQQNFEILSTTPNILVLQFYNDSLIGSIFSTTTHTINNKMYIISLQDISSEGYSLTNINTGSMLVNN